MMCAGFPSSELFLVPRKNHHRLFRPAALAFAQRAFAACAIRLRPAALILRLGFAGLFCLAHLARCAAAMRARPAALIPRRLPGPLAVAVLPKSRPSSLWRVSIFSLMSAA